MMEFNPELEKLVHEVRIEVDRQGGLSNVTPREISDRLMIPLSLAVIALDRLSQENQFNEV